MIITFKSHCKVCGKPLGVFDNDTCGTCERWLKIIKDIKAKIRNLSDLKTDNDKVWICDVLEIIDKHIGRVKKG